MADVPDVQITVRYFAAARAAAGIETETLSVPTGTTVHSLLDELACRGPELAKVLARCSFLRDGVAVRDRHDALQTNQTVDVLPPSPGDKGDLHHITKWSRTGYGQVEQRVHLRKRRNFLHI